MLFRGGHAFGPDMKTAAILEKTEESGNLPRAPDAFALVVSLVKHIVLAEVLFGPITFAVGQLVSPAENKRPDIIAALPRKGAVLKGQVQFHHALASMLEKIPRPRPARKARIGFQCRCLRLAHGLGPLIFLQSHDAAPTLGEDGVAPDALMLGDALAAADDAKAAGQLQLDAGLVLRKSGAAQGPNTVPLRGFDHGLEQTLAHPPAPLTGGHL